ncbi:hypothetical protein GWI33_011962 [Rhynchophorus ferrugineus]|uniref:Uncharacterized protein n=1 Tax=Rhynchophorus ferrugineus TaxID=354439 RepID=A0A834ISB3_RHYFE|nr:hypothetical protein GWI33_011962 [Rhynchophorus ferrugineus]
MAKLSGSLTGNKAAKTVSVGHPSTLAAVAPVARFGFGPGDSDLRFRKTGQFLVPSSSSRRGLINGPLPMTPMKYVRWGAADNRDFSIKTRVRGIMGSTDERGEGDVAASM